MKNVEWIFDLDPVAQLEQFRRQGYIHIPGVLSEQEVADLRRDLDDKFQEMDSKHDSENHRNIRPWWTYNQPRISKLVLDERIVAALKCVCGDDVFCPTTMSIARNQVGHGKIKLFNIPLPNGRGWHVDSARDGKQKYLTEDSYRMFKCGVYLQDNDEDFGGGVDVAPGCHRFPIKLNSVDRMFKAKTARDLLALTFNKHTVPLKAGDFLAFDYRIPHRSTLPKKIMHHATNADKKNGQLEVLKSYRPKYVIYFDAGNEGSVQTYIDMMTRDILKSLKNGTFYADMNSAAAGQQLNAHRALQHKMEQSGMQFLHFSPEVEQKCWDLLSAEIAARS